MNKDKAIQLLERLQDPEPYEPMLTKDAYDAIQMAIDALSADGDTISRKAAIDAINHELRCGAVIDQCGLETAHDLIKELPPAQLGTNLAEVGTDCISRREALDIFDDYNVAVENGQIEAYSRDRKRLCDLPPAQPARIKGRWIEKPHVHGVAYCSLCDYELHTNDTNFCPNCGAKMEVTT